MDIISLGVKIGTEHGPTWSERGVVYAPMFRLSQDRICAIAELLLFLEFLITETLPVSR